MMKGRRMSCVALAAFTLAVTALFIKEQPGLRFVPAPGQKSQWRDGPQSGRPCHAARLQPMVATPETLNVVPLCLLGSLALAAVAAAQRRKALRGGITLRAKAEKKVSVAQLSDSLSKTPGRLKHHFEVDVVINGVRFGIDNVVNLPLVAKEHCKISVEAVRNTVDAVVQFPAKAKDGVDGFVSNVQQTATRIAHFPTFVKESVEHFADGVKSTVTAVVNFPTVAKEHIDESASRVKNVVTAVVNFSTAAKALVDDSVTAVQTTIEAVVSFPRRAKEQIDHSLEAVSSTVDAVAGSVAKAKEKIDDALDVVKTGVSSVVQIFDSAKHCVTAVVPVQQVNFVSSAVTFGRRPAQEAKPETAVGTDVGLTEAEATTLLNEWGNEILELETVHTGYGDYTSQACSMLQRAYAQEEGFPVYWVDGVKVKNFLSGWTRFRLQRLSLNSQDGTATGLFGFIDHYGKETKFHFTVGFARKMGRLEMIHREIALLGVTPWTVLAVAAVNLTKHEVSSFLYEWGNEIVEIGTVRTGDGDDIEKAASMVKRMYAHEEDLPSYLVGGARVWTKFRLCSLTVSNADDTATGFFCFTDSSGKESKFQYSFIFTRKLDGLKVVRQEIREGSVAFTLPPKPVAGWKVTDGEVATFLRCWSNLIMEIGAVRRGHRTAQAHPLKKRSFVQELHFLRRVCGEAAAHEYAGWTKFRLHTVTVNNQDCTATCSFSFLDSTGRWTMFRCGFGVRKEMGRLKITDGEPVMYAPGL